jgi:hypothetical protein
METITLINVDELNALLKKHHAEIKSDLEGSLLSGLKSQIVEGFCGRFFHVFISPDEVARMHGVHKTTVIEYIKDGTIAAEQTKKYGDYHIRLSDALRFDFKEMRRQLRRKQS